MIRTFLVLLALLWTGCGYLAGAGEYAYRMPNADLGCGDIAHRDYAWKVVGGLIPYGPIGLIVGAASTGGYRNGFRVQTHGHWCGDDGEVADRCWLDANMPENQTFCRAVRR